MPDRHGFNLLGETVRCIDCPAGGPLWHWPERKRRRHARSHRAVARRGGRDVRRQRILLAAPPTHTNEEKEASTMAKQTTTKGEPAKQVAIDVLRTAGEPLHAKEIAAHARGSRRSPPPDQQPSLGRAGESRCGGSRCSSDHRPKVRVQPSSGHLTHRGHTGARVRQHRRG